MYWDIQEIFWLLYKVLGVLCGLYMLLGIIYLIVCGIKLIF